MTWFVRLLADEAGATLVQYALVTATLSVAMIGALAAIAAVCASRLGNTSSKLTALAASPP